MSGLHPADWAMIVAYLIGITMLGVWTSRRVSSQGLEFAWQVLEMRGPAAALAATFTSRSAKSPTRASSAVAMISTAPSNCPLIIDDHE